jgi:enoyl-CoA hydratase/carnithine racemase
MTASDDASAAADAYILISTPADGVRQITMNRPTKLNAMTVSMVEHLHQALDEVAADRHCRVVILAGAGRGFCAGLDLSGYGIPPGHEGRGKVPTDFAMQQHIAALIPHLRKVPQPVSVSLDH